MNKSQDAFTVDEAPRMQDSGIDPRAAIKFRELGITDIGATVAPWQNSIEGATAADSRRAQ